MQGLFKRGGGAPLRGGRTRTLKRLALRGFMNAVLGNDTMSSTPGLADLLSSATFHADCAACARHCKARLLPAVAMNAGDGAIRRSGGWSFGMQDFVLLGDLKCRRWSDCRKSSWVRAKPSPRQRRRPPYTSPHVSCRNSSPKASVLHLAEEQLSEVLQAFRCFLLQNWLPRPRDVSKYTKKKRGRAKGGPKTPAGDQKKKKT